LVTEHSAIFIYLLEISRTAYIEISSFKCHSISLIIDGFYVDIYRRGYSASKALNEH